MRHGLLATDAGLILPAHNYTHQQHLFSMDESQLQIHIFPAWGQLGPTTLHITLAAKQLVGLENTFNASLVFSDVSFGTFCFVLHVAKSVRR